MIDPTDARNQVEADVAGALGAQLPDGEGWAIDETFERWEADPLANAESTALVVPWTWRGTNMGLLGLDPTRREVTVRGVTIITEDPDVEGGLLCHRYVDWLPALAQAGIEVFTRPLVELGTVYSEAELRETPELAEALDELALLLRPDD